MAITQTYTAEEAAALALGWDFELIDGELFTLPGSGGQSSGVAARILIEIGIYLKSNPIYEITGEAGGYIISRDPDTLFCPDVGLIRKDRLPNRTLPRTFVDAFPDFAVEVHSPSDRALDDQRKVRRYLEAGVSLVWLVEPESRTVTVHRSNRQPRTYTIGDRLSGEDVLPGFELRVADIFA